MREPINDSNEKGTKMTKPQIIIALLTLLIAFSGWGIFIYERLTSKPKLEGRILNVITGQMNNPKIPGENLTVFNVYLFITNSRKFPVYIYDYILEIDKGLGYQETKQLYGYKPGEKRNFPSKEYNIDIPDYFNTLIYNKKTPVDYGIPLHGIAPFSTPGNQTEIVPKVKKYRVTVTDVFNRKHVIETRIEDMASIRIMNQISDIRVSRKKKE